MTANLPGPVNVGDFYLAAIHGALAEQNALLGEIRDRLGQANEETPPAGEPDGPQPVELREPDPAAKPEPGPADDSDPKPAPRKRATRTKGTR